MMALFSVSALFVCEHVPALSNEGKRLWEEQIVCMSCFEEDVLECAVCYFKSQELEYETTDGKAEWKFYGIIDIYEIPESERIGKIDVPIEFFSRLLTDRQAKDLCRHNKIFQDFCRSHGLDIHSETK